MITAVATVAENDLVFVTSGCTDGTRLALDTGPVVSLNHVVLLFRDAKTFNVRRAEAN